MVKANPVLASVQISEVMRSPVETLLTNNTLAEAIGRFDGGRPGYPVIDGSGRLQGYCGRAELFGTLRELPSLEKSVSDLIAADQSIIDAVVIMLREEIEMLPVVSSQGVDGVIGVVSPLDVIKKHLRCFEGIQVWQQRRGDRKSCATLGHVASLPERAQASEA